MNKVTKIIVLLAPLLMAFKGVTTSASAQEGPKFTFPTDGSTATGDIGIVRVGFDEAIDPALSGLELRNGAARILADGAGYGNCDSLSCHLYLGHLEPDQYTVTYNVITASGKVLQSQFKFSVADTN